MIPFTTSTAQQTSRSGGFDLPCSADTAFPFFSPEGEREWVKAWNPTPVFPETIEFQRDTVFREGSAGEEAVWTIVDVAWKTYRAEYVRVASLSHAARIVVQIEPVSTERCKVTVSYTVTAFGEKRDSLIEAFAEHAYAATMRAWQEQVSSCLKNRK